MLTTLQSPVAVTDVGDQENVLREKLLAFGVPGAASKWFPSKEGLPPQKLAQKTDRQLALGLNGL
jgi:hypothetical protein